MAEASDILAAIKAVLETAYPATPVRTSKRAAAGGKQLVGGWAQGYPTTCFVVSCSDGEEVDKCGDFEYVSVGYKVVVEYVKPAQAAVAAAVDSGPAPVVEDPDVRDKRETMRGALYKTLAGVGGAFDTRHRSLPAYDQPGEGGAVLLVSGQEYTITTVVPRP